MAKQAQKVKKSPNPFVKGPSLRAGKQAHASLFDVTPKSPAEEEWYWKWKYGGGPAPTPPSQSADKKRGRPKGAAARGGTSFAGKKIKLLAKKNPKKPGSKSYEVFALYRDGMTVEEFFAKGGGADHIKWDTARGFIAVE